MASRIVRWRGSLPRRIALRSPNRSSSRLGDLGDADAIGPAPRRARWRAGCRRAVGRSPRPPGRRVVEDEASDRRPGPAPRRARPPGWPSRSSAEIVGSGAAVDNGSTDHTCSPATASGSRLVATIDTVGASLRMRLTSAATGSMRCSQLSSSSRLWRGRSISTIASSIELLRRRLTSIGGRERRRRGLLVDDAHELDHVHAVRVAGRDAARELETERGLADTAGPDERDQAMRRERVDEQRQERLATDQRLDGGLAGRRSSGSARLGGAARRRRRSRSTAMNS